MADSDKSYIAISPCGCVTAAMVAGYDTARSEKAELKRWMKSGRTVEVTTAGDARERLTFNCPHGGAGRDRPADMNSEADRLVAEARG